MSTDNGTVSVKQIERWKRTSANCDHTKHTETIDGYKVCFCTKLSNVIQTNSGVTPSDFSLAIAAHTLANTPPEIIEEIREAINTMKEGQ